MLHSQSLGTWLCSGLRNSSLYRGLGRRERRLPGSFDEVGSNFFLGVAIGVGRKMKPKNIVEKQVVKRMLRSPSRVPH